MPFSFWYTLDCIKKVKIMKKYKRYLLTAAASVALGLNCLAVTAEEDENKAFEEFMNSEFKEMMESDYLTLHFTIKDYSALDIDKPELEKRHGRAMKKPIRKASKQWKNSIPSTVPSFRQKIRSTMTRMNSICRE